jgi:transposase
MARKKRVNAVGMASAGRFDVAAGGDVDKDVVVIGIYKALENSIETKEFEQTHTGAEAAARWLLENQVEIIILESTANYHLLFFDTFRKFVLNVKVINPMLVKALLRVEGKSDKGDAMTLAQLAASFKMRVSNMPDASQREIRAYLRGIDQLKQRRTQLSNRINSTLTAHGIVLFRKIKLSSVSGKLMLGLIIEGHSAQEVVELGWKGKKASIPIFLELLGNLENLPRYVRSFLYEYKVEYDSLTDRIQLREEQAISLIFEMGLQDQISQMITAPAINPLLALRFIGELGQNYWERYDTADAFCKAIGIVPNNIVSGGKILKKKTSHGNIHVKLHLLNTVKAWILHASEKHPLKKFYLDYKSRSSFRRATSAVARKIARALWFMGRNGQTYKVNVITHEEVSNV